MELQKVISKNFITFCSFTFFWIADALGSTVVSNLFVIVKIKDSCRWIPFHTFTTLVVDFLYCLPTLNVPNQFGSLGSGSALAIPYGSGSRNRKILSKKLNLIFKNVSTWVVCTFCFRTYPIKISNILLSIWTTKRKKWENLTFRVIYGGQTLIVIRIRIVGKLLDPDPDPHWDQCCYKTLCSRIVLPTFPLCLLLRTTS